MRILVTGAGGFIGSHLVTRLKYEGHEVMGVDLKLPEFSKSNADRFLLGDLRQPDFAEFCMRWTPHQVYALAADMGGMGFISSHHAQILRNNLLINLNTIEAASIVGVKRYLFSSSACVYPEYLQEHTDLRDGLKESSAYPAQPQDAYGWEKLITERLCAHYQADYGLSVRVARFHNIYGPNGTWQGGREKAPAAICRKVAEAKLKSETEIEIWGDGKQTRSFCYIDDCVEGLLRLMESDYSEPVNIGSREMVSINELVVAVATVAGWPVVTKHVDGPLGVRGRNSNNELSKEILHWAPVVLLQEGIERTYPWIEEQVKLSVREEIAK